MTVFIIKICTNIVLLSIISLEEHNSHRLNIPQFRRYTNSPFSQHLRPFFFNINITALSYINRQIAMKVDSTNLGY